MTGIYYGLQNKKIKEEKKERKKYIQLLIDEKTSVHHNNQYLGR